MVALRKFGGVYLAAASFYTVAVMLSHQPLMVQQANNAARALSLEVAAASDALLHEWSWPSTNSGTQGQSVELTLAPANRIAAAVPQLRPSLPAQSFSHRPRRRELAPAPKMPASGLPASAQIVQAEHRLNAGLKPELLANFDLFLYVSKAESGAIAQRMYVFRKEAGGNLALLHDWPVSTGRERVEYNSAGRRLPSFTPAGYYELDPDRFFTHYHSAQWDQSMPYAMFFNWIRNGSLTGLAIHSAVGRDIALLGRRASAGCVRLSPEAARTLFTLIRTQYRGPAPRFDIDRATGTMNNNGVLMRGADGKVERAEGYKVLVFIENYGGRNIVATLF
jgi:lipoprotein-anchoring transpeptidase ErfK/SrfK